MDYQSVGVLHDKDGGNTTNNQNPMKMGEKETLTPTAGSHSHLEQVNVVNCHSRENVLQDEGFANVDSFGEVNMEATITPDDIMKAGGFGARDDISSLLPVASDSTDFEASLRGAQDYEQSREEIRRPGLGWREEPK